MNRRQFIIAGGATVAALILSIPPGNVTPPSNLVTKVPSYQPVTDIFIKSFDFGHKWGVCWRDPATDKRHALSFYHQLSAEWFADHIQGLDHKAVMAVYEHETPRGDPRGDYV